MADCTGLYSTYRKVSCMYGSWQDHPYIASMRKVRTIEDPPPLPPPPWQPSQCRTQGVRWSMHKNPIVFWPGMGGGGGGQKPGNIFIWRREEREWEWEGGERENGIKRESDKKEEERVTMGGEEREWKWEGERMGWGERVKRKKGRENDNGRGREWEGEVERDREWEEETEGQMEGERVREGGGEKMRMREGEWDKEEQRCWWRDLNIGGEWEGY